jgi:hypothetical protein
MVRYGSSDSFVQFKFISRVNNIKPALKAQSAYIDFVRSLAQTNPRLFL